MEMTLEKEYQKFLEHLASNIRKQRNKRNLTQEEMAEQLRLNYRYYQKLESGSYSPRLHTLFKLSRLLKTRLIDLLG